MTAHDLPTPSKTEAAIEQLNLGYNPEQDRLLLKVGLNDNTELVLWLTQRITHRLWHLLNAEAHLPTANSISLHALPHNAVQQFKQEMQASESLQKMDFATDYAPRAEVIKASAFLVIEVQISNAEAQALALEVTCLEGLTVRMNLTQELNLALCNMLQLCAKEALWNLAEVSTTEARLSVGSGKVLH